MILDKFKLDGRVAVVSGAASGMGKNMAIGLAEAGANLLLADINDEGMQATADEITALGRRAVPVHCDVSCFDDIEALWDVLDSEYGKVDFLGNVAGEGVLSRPEELTDEQLTQVLQNLVIGRYAMSRNAGQRMIRDDGGSIVSIGSLASISAMGRGHVAYSMAMGAVAQMTRELSTEWATYGIRVNAILPAQVTNPGLIKRMDEDPNLHHQFISGIPIGRMGSPEEIKGIAVWLASGASSFTTGALIPFDGGNLAMNGGGTPGWVTRQRLEESAE
jgi:NAD(P)-dependent dehydrogenase (short-subunit alcohol dehydrogenase family)